MAIFNFFSSKPSSSAIEKQITKIKEVYGQSELRKAAMETLLKWNTQESIDGVVQRFDVVVQSPHWDLEEKKWLVDELVSRGEFAKKAIISYLDHSNSVGYAILALRRMVDEAELLAIFSQALEKHSPEDYRFAQAKQELIIAIDELAVIPVKTGIQDSGNSLDPRFREHDSIVMNANSPSDASLRWHDIHPCILPYINDLNDDVVCLVASLIKDHRAKNHAALLLNKLYDETLAPRVLRHIADVLCYLEIPLQKDKSLPSDVTDDFDIVNNQLVRKGAAQKNG